MTQSNDMPKEIYLIQPPDCDETEVIWTTDPDCYDGAEAHKYIRASQSPAVDADVQARDWDLVSLVRHAFQSGKGSIDFVDYEPPPQYETIQRALTATKHEGVNEKLVEALNKIVDIVDNGDSETPFLAFKIQLREHAHQAIKSAQLSCSTGTKDKVEVIPNLEAAIKDLDEDGEIDRHNEEAIEAAARAYLKLQQLTKKD